MTDLYELQAKLPHLSQWEKQLVVDQLKQNLQQTIALKVITWIVTYQCHLDCSYCYVATNKAAKATDSTITRPNLLNALAQARALGAEQFSLRGGEPFLRGDLLAILGHADTLGYQLDLFTKIALPRRQIEGLAGLRALSLGVSLDTIDPKVGDDILRRAGQTVSLMRAIDRLTRTDISLTIEATVTSRTIGGLRHLIDFARKVGVRRLHLRQVAPHSIRPVQQLLISEAQARETEELARCEGDDALRVTFTPAFRDTPSCGEGLSAITLLPDGRVTKSTASLSRHPAMIYGDVNRETLVEILAGSRLAYLLRQVADSGADLPRKLRPAAGALPCSMLVAASIGKPFRDRIE
jgi:MoaA/NifB/PqqE/SkfB family radical SAM enzyme